MRVLISVLGDFTSYKEVIYSINNYESKSYISSKVLYEYLKPDITITFIPFTLYHKLRKKPKGGRYRELADELLSASQKYVKEFYSEGKNVEFFVAPAVGTFFNHDKLVYTEKDRGLNLYPNYVYYKIVSELEKTEGSSVEFHVDLTHGINYMPALLANVITIIANSIGKQVKLSFYNSDPLAGKFEEKNPPTLNINEVSRYVIKPKDGMNFITTQFMSIDENYFRKVIQDSNTITEIRKLAKAFQAGLFLLLNYYKKNINEVKRQLEEKLKGIDDMEVVIEGCKVKYNYSLHHSAYILHAMLSILSKVSLGKDELEAVELTKLAKSYANELSKELLSNEIDNISDRIKKIEIEVPNYMKLAEILKRIDEEGGKKEEEKSSDTPNKRNLIAHGGLERNVTFVRYTGGKLYFKYKNPEKVLDQL